MQRLIITTGGTKNVILSSRAGDALTVGGNNVAIGDSALSSDTQGSKSVAIGDSALYNQNFTSATDTYSLHSITTVLTTQ